MLRSQWGIAENGLLQRIWGTTRDITGLKNAKLALDASEQRMADLIDTLQLVTVVLDTDGTVTYCNEQLRRLTGSGPAEVIGKNFFDLMPPEERNCAQAAFAIA